MGIKAQPTLETTHNTIQFLQFVPHTVLVLKAKSGGNNPFPPKTVLLLSLFLNFKKCLDQSNMAYIEYCEEPENRYIPETSLEIQRIVFVKKEQTQMIFLKI